MLGIVLSPVPSELLSFSNCRKADEHYFGEGISTLSGFVEYYFNYQVNKQQLLFKERNDKGHRRNFVYALAIGIGNSIIIIVNR